MMKKKHIKDPGSAITHFIGMLMAIFAAFPLLIKAAHEPSRIYLISLAIYAVSLILLYAASTTYHTFDFPEKDRPYDDLRTDRRKLHTNLPAGTGTQNRTYHACTCMGYRNHRNYYQRVLGILPEMGILRPLH